MLFFKAKARATHPKAPKIGRYNGNYRLQTVLEPHASRPSATPGDPPNWIMPVILLQG